MKYVPDKLLLGVLLLTSGINSYMMNNKSVGLELNDVV